MGHDHRCVKSERVQPGREKSVTANRKSIQPLTIEAISRARTCRGDLVRKGNTEICLVPPDCLRQFWLRARWPLFVSKARALHFAI